VQKTKSLYKGEGNPTRRKGLKNLQQYQPIVLEGHPKNGELKFKGKTGPKKKVGGTGRAVL